MTLTLHVGSKRYSSWSLRPYLALAHTGQPFETKVIILDQPETRAYVNRVILVKARYKRLYRELR